MWTPESLKLAIRGKRILVIGDAMLDRYTWGHVRRVSPEAPVLVLTIERHDASLGGAASVARMLQSWGAAVSLAAAVGADHNASVLRQLLADEGIDHSCLVIDEDRPTTCKERLMGQIDARSPHQMLRVDHEVTTPLSTSSAASLATACRDELVRCAAVLISDYGKGVVSDDLIREVIDACEALQIPVAVDPARGKSFLRYLRASCLKPNRIQAEEALGRRILSPDDAIEAARDILDQHRLEHVVITLDRQGIVCVGRNGDSAHFPTNVRQVADITGAGDTVLAMIGAGLAAGEEMSRILELANTAAAIQVESVGVGVVNWTDIARRYGTHRRVASKVHSRDELVRICERKRSAGKRIVFTNGCFDLLHFGHTSYLQEAASLGDFLVVAINSDSSVRRLKGDSRPLIEETQRAEMLSALACVDAVTIYEDDTPNVLLRSLRPEVLVKGGDYALDQVVGAEIVRQYGGDVRVVSYVNGLSTTRLIQRVMGGS